MSKVQNAIQFPPEFVARGHFRYESGHHGDLWLNLDKLFVDARRMRDWIATLAQRTEACNPQVMCGALTGGAFVAQTLAAISGVEFVFAERFIGADGSAQYRIPEALRSVLPGKRCLLVDDAINAGSALLATLRDAQTCGAEIAGIASLMLLGDTARTIAARYQVPLFTLVSLERGMWLPDDCPLCRAKVPLTDHFAPPSET